MELFKQCDFHVHTIFSPCASSEMNLEDIIDTQIKREVKYMGITDHVMMGTDLSILQQTRDKIAQINPKIQVFVGCEVDIISDGHDLVSKQVLDSVDYVSVAANHFQMSYVEKPASSSIKDVGEHFLKMFRYACSLKYVDVIVHPMTVMMNMFDPSCLDILQDDDISEALNLAKENNIAIEISPRALYPEQLYFRVRFYELCKKAGLKFSIGSDAHRLETLAPGNLLNDLIKRLEITNNDIWLPKNAV